MVMEPNTLQSWSSGLTRLGFFLHTDPKAALEELQHGLNGPGARWNQALLPKSGHSLRGSSTPAHWRKAARPAKDEAIRVERVIAPGASPSTHFLAAQPWH